MSQPRARCPYARRPATRRKAPLSTCAAPTLPAREPLVEEPALTLTGLGAVELPELEEETYAELQLEEEFLVAGSPPAGRGLAT